MKIVALATLLAVCSSAQAWAGGLFLSKAKKQIAHAKLDRMHSTVVERHSLKGRKPASQAQRANRAEVRSAVTALRRAGYQVSWQPAKGPTGIHRMTVSW